MSSCHMSRDVDSVTSQVHELIPFNTRGVPQKYTGSRAWLELMTLLGWCRTIAETPKSSELTIGRLQGQGQGSRSKRCVFVALWKEGLEGLWSWEWHHLLFTWCCSLRRGISVFLISFDRFYASIGRCTSDRVTPDIDDDWLLPHLSDTSVAVPTVTPHIPISSFPRT